MTTNYSFLKGFGKGIVGAAIAGLAIVAYIASSAYPDIYNAPIADLIYVNLKELLGSMTVGGLIAFIINFAKHYR